MAATPRRRTARYHVSQENQGWSAAEVRALREHLGVTQEELSRRLGMRQQTVSEWEVGKHRPRGASLTLLNVIAEGAGFAYRTDHAGEAMPDALPQTGIGSGHAG